jgi:DNA-binding HxlR family transcriptional regulator
MILGDALEPRAHGQYCPISRAADLLGERWTMLIVRELLTGPKRFTDLARRFPGIGRNLLTERLRQLQSDGVIERVGRRYELTDLGRDLLPALDALGIWGMRLLEAHPSGRVVSAVWPTLSMRAAGDPRACLGVHATVALAVGDERFWVELDDGEVRIREDAPPAPPALTITCDTDAYLAVACGAISVSHALVAGLLGVEGDPALLDLYFQVLKFPPYPAMEAILAG